MTNLLGSIRLAAYAFPLIAALVAVPFFCLLYTSPSPRD